MKIKRSILALACGTTRRNIRKASTTAVRDQQRLFTELIRKASNTDFGKTHGFSAIRSHEDYVRHVPVRDYEALRPFIDKVTAGRPDVLWPGRPLYLAKTSGTTSGVKYIPITRDSIPNHVNSARRALFNAAGRQHLTSVFDGKMIFLSGSPELDNTGGIPTGRLSGIVNHWVPGWLRTNQLPSYETNCIDDWETKVDRIAHETLKADMRLISGIPPWVQMYYERLLDITGKSTVKEIFPNLQLFIYGGVNFEPYRTQLERLTGGRIHSVETFPASEGFIAFQDLDDASEGLLLQTHSGIFFEFIPVSSFQSPEPERLTLEQVETGINYVVILSSNAGLWAYNLGDTIEFVSLAPYRVRVTGRIKHFISAFGEHVIAKEVEEALRLTTEQYPCRINEFTVAPQVNPPDGSKPYHEWWIEFAESPADLHAFAEKLNREMTVQNIYYRDLIDGNILQPLHIRVLPPGAFVRFMQEAGKLGGQNKVPRLSNDRTMADKLQALLPGRG